MIQTDILLILIFAVSILASILVGLLLIGYYRAEVTIVRATIFGVTGYFMAYIVISAFFFVFDYFSIFKCTLATLAAVLIALVVIVMMFVSGVKIREFALVGIIKYNS